VSLCPAEQAFRQKAATSRDGAAADAGQQDDTGTHGHLVKIATVASILLTLAEAQLREQRY